MYLRTVRGETRTPSYRAAVNEMGEVPVLVHGTRKLSQSGVCLTYLAERTGKFAPEGEDHRTIERMRRLLMATGVGKRICRTPWIIRRQRTTSACEATPLLRVGTCANHGACDDEQDDQTRQHEGSRPE